VEIGLAKADGAYLANIRKNIVNGRNPVTHSTTSMMKITAIRFDVIETLLTLASVN
jgi:hypothetical protein